MASGGVGGQITLTVCPLDRLAPVNITVALDFCGSLGEFFSDKIKKDPGWVNGFGFHLGLLPWRC